MPVTWTVRGPVVIVRIAGQYEFPEIKRAVTEAYAATTTPPEASLLMDARTSRALVPPGEIQRRAEWLGALLTHRRVPRCAVVVGRSAYRRHVAEAGLTPLRQAGLPVEYFTEFERAVEWLVPGRDLPREPS